MLKLNLTTKRPAPTNGKLTYSPCFEQLNFKTLWSLLDRNKLGISTSISQRKLAQLTKMPKRKEIWPIFHFIDIRKLIICLVVPCCGDHITSCNLIKNRPPHVGRLNSENVQVIWHKAFFIVFNFDISIIAPAAPFCVFIADEIFNRYRYPKHKWFCNWSTNFHTIQIKKNRDETRKRNTFLSYCAKIR